MARPARRQRRELEAALEAGEDPEDTGPRLGYTVRHARRVARRIALDRAELRKQTPVPAPTPPEGWDELRAELQAYPRRQLQAARLGLGYLARVVGDESTPPGLRVRAAEILYSRGPRFPEATITARRPGADGSEQQVELTAALDPETLAQAERLLEGGR